MSKEELSKVKKQWIAHLKRMIEEVRVDVSDTQGAELSKPSIKTMFLWIINKLKQLGVSKIDEAQLNKLLKIVNSTKFLKDPEECINDLNEIDKYF